MQNNISRRSIDLDISGGDLIVRGHFNEWESGLMFGPDLDQVTIRLAIDATSAGAEDVGSLFSFHSRDVRSEGDGPSRALGVFTGPVGSKAMEMLIESPPGHSALVSATFTAKKQDFGDRFPDLIENVAPFYDVIDGIQVRPAHAWLVTPGLGLA